MSILSRGSEIEDDFYHLKAQEWAVEPAEAKRRIEAAMKEILTQVKADYPDWHAPGTFPG